MVQFLCNLYREQYTWSSFYVIYTGSRTHGPVSCSLYREQYTWSSFYVIYTGSSTHGPVSM